MEASGALVRTRSSSTVPTARVCPGSQGVGALDGVALQVQHRHGVGGVDGQRAVEQVGPAVVRLPVG